MPQSEALLQMSERILGLEDEVRLLRTERVSKLEDEIRHLRNTTPHIQNGHVKIEGIDNAAKGDRSASLYVKFKPPFSSEPRVHASLCLLELADCHGSNRPTMRVYVQSEKITKEGFELTLKTWGSSRVYQAHVAWVAYAPLES